MSKRWYRADIGMKLGRHVADIGLTFGGHWLTIGSYSADIQGTTGKQEPTGRQGFWNEMGTGRDLVLMGILALECYC